MTQLQESSRYSCPDCVLCIEKSLSIDNTKASCRHVDMVVAHLEQGWAALSPSPSTTLTLLLTLHFFGKSFLETFSFSFSISYKETNNQ